MRDSKVYFHKMLEYVQHAQDMIKGIEFNSFVSNSEKAFACAFAISQIGEYANKFSEEQRNIFPQLPWKKMREMRNLLVHNYDSVNFDIVWDTITISLPKLKADIETILEQL